MSKRGPTFVWRMTRGVFGPSCALYPDGYYPSKETADVLLKAHEIRPDEIDLDLAELARRYPAPEVVIET